MDQSSSSIWEDWGDLLDFTVDPSDPFLLPTFPPPLLPPPPPPPPPPSEVNEASSKMDKPMASKVRKRDPRLVCENYLAGRVPCACPELDAMMLEQEDEEKEKKKRVRIRVRDGDKKDVVRCQVVGCEVDIGELKGYHKRHKVCLKCANAERVCMDGEDKRYCQQCGKFHILPDFDEGKRSCRRKLERHNRRRRRKPTDDTSLIEDKGPHQVDKSTEAAYDVERNDENGVTSETVICSRVNDADVLVESDEHASPVSPIPNSQNFQSNGDASFVNPGEAYTNEGKDKTKLGISTTSCDNINTYSSLCPTGRISFKLYDWNPAEFPRRLRHQIFQWLASMPVELEGYVRPGCTILTIFIAMPQLMWDKLSQDAAVYIKELINAPESLLLGRKNIFIFLGNTIIQVLKDGSSLVNIKMEVKAPVIHYVYPSFFEAGKPIELVVCGSNLIQPKFRFLVSFAGKYMAYDSCAMAHGTITKCDGNEDLLCHGSNHDMLRIHLSQMESKVFGPAFVEVENESGISNFIPILVGNKKICSELERLQLAFGGSMAQIAVLEANPDLCELIARKQTVVSELLVDIAWLLKEPSAESSEAYLTAINLQRLTSLLKIVMQYELFGVMELVLNYLDTMFSKTKDSENVAPDVDVKSFQEYVSSAKQMLGKRELGDLTPKTELIISKQLDVNLQEYAISARNQDEEFKSEYCMCSSASSTVFRDENTQLISPRSTHKKHDISYIHVDWSRNQWAHKISGTRLMLYVMVSVVMCLGACTVLLHPLNPGEIAVSIRRCLFGYRSP